MSVKEERGFTTEKNFYRQQNELVRMKLQKHNQGIFLGSSKQQRLSQDSTQLYFPEYVGMPSRDGN